MWSASSNFFREEEDFIAVAVRLEGFFLTSTNNLEIMNKVIEELLNTNMVTTQVYRNQDVDFHLHV